MKRSGLTLKTILTLITLFLLLPFMVKAAQHVDVTPTASPTVEPAQLTTTPTISITPSLTPTPTAVPATPTPTSTLTPSLTPTPTANPSSTPVPTSNRPIIIKHKNGVQFIPQNIVTPSITLTTVPVPSPTMVATPVEDRLFPKNYIINKASGNDYSYEKLSPELTRNLYTLSIIYIIFGISFLALPAERLNLKKKKTPVFEKKPIEMKDFVYS